MRKEAVKFRHLLSWDTMMGSDGYWKQASQERAEAAVAPLDAIYLETTSGKWARASELRADHNFHKFHEEFWADVIAPAPEVAPESKPDIPRGAGVAFEAEQESTMERLLTLILWKFFPRGHTLSLDQTDVAAFEAQYRTGEALLFQRYKSDGVEFSIIDRATAEQILQENSGIDNSGPAH